MTHTRWFVRILQARKALGPRTSLMDPLMVATAPGDEGGGGVRRSRIRRLGGLSRRVGTLLGRAGRLVRSDRARAALTIAATVGLWLPHVAPIAALGRWARVALVARQLAITFQASLPARSTPALRS